MLPLTIKDKKKVIADKTGPKAKKITVEKQFKVDTAAAPVLDLFGLGMNKKRALKNIPTVDSLPMDTP